MCGRFTLQTPETNIREVFNLPIGVKLGLKPRYNIAPSQDIPIIRDTKDGPELTLARWGLVPHWSKEPTTKYSTINARIETVAEKPTYHSLVFTLTQMVDTFLLFINQTIQYLTLGQRFCMSELFLYHLQIQLLHYYHPN